MKKIIKTFIVFIFLLHLTGCDFGKTPEHKHIECPVCGLCKADDCDKTENDKCLGHTESIEIYQYYIDDLLISEGSKEEVEIPEIPDKVDKYEWVLTKEVIGDKTYYKYNLDYTLKRFIVVFRNPDKSIIKQEMVNYGGKATEPIMEERLEVTWDQDFSYVTEPLDIYAQITYKYYYLEFYDNGEKLDIGIDRYKPGEELTLPDYQKTGYDFVGWYNSSLSLYRYNEITEDMTGDLRFIAKFNQTNFENVTLPIATAHFTGIKKVPNGSVFTYQPIMPSGVNQSVTAYDWTTSNSKVATVSIYSSITCGEMGYCVLTATLKDNKNVKINCFIKVTSNGVELTTEEEINSRQTVNIIFKGLNGEVIEEQQIIEGNAFNYPMPPVKDGYKFVGWDQELYTSYEDVVINAVYEEGFSEYNGKKFSIIGDSISTYNHYIPSGYSYFYPYPTADLYSVNQTWWMRVINSLGAGLFVNNSYSGSCVCGNNASSSQNPERIAKLVENNQTPDYIIILMGSNDAHAKYNNEMFEQAYEKMIREIEKVAPNAKLILCTLPKSNLYTDEVRFGYNEIIRNLALKYNQILVDLETTDITGALVDSAHPNNSGMEIISDAILNGLKKEK